MKKIYSLFILSLLFFGACSTTPQEATPERLGRDDAPVLIEEFSDPQCPACAVISPQVETFVRNNPDLVRLEYHHFPLPYHEYAFIASEATSCAGDQGKFFEYLDIIFGNQDSLNEDYLYKAADSLKLDRSAFEQCMNEHMYKSQVLASMAEGTRRQIPGTPTLFVNGQIVKWTDPETFKAYVESLK